MTSQVSLKRIKKPDEINHFIIHKSADTESDWKKSLSTVTITLNETIEFKSINPETNYTNQIVYFQCIELSESLEPLLEFIDPIPICHGFQFEKLKVISYDSEMEQLNQELESILEFKVKNAIYVVGQRGNGKRTLIK
jgi:predicted AAA+ superfamily ATPase